MENKYQALKQWLNQEYVSHQVMIVAMCRDTDKNEAAIRIKAGHIESLQFILQQMDNLDDVGAREFANSVMIREENKDE